MELTRIVVCACGVPARVREIPYDLGGTPLRDWAPCLENYTFTDEAGGTRVRVDCDVFGTYEDWMAQTWPQALQSLKTVCETPT